MYVLVQMQGRVSAGIATCYVDIVGAPDTKSGAKPIELARIIKVRWSLSTEYLSSFSSVSILFLRVTRHFLIGRKSELGQLEWFNEKSELALKLETPWGTMEFVGTGLLSYP
jgi:hypothetical protein